MQIVTTSCSAEEVDRNAECLLGRLQEVQLVLRRRNFSEHAIDHAVSAVYLAAMPYITGRKPCPIENRRAWVFKVAFRAAGRAARREFRWHAVEPAILAATTKTPHGCEEIFDLCGALRQLTMRQSQTIELCVLGGLSVREAARSMGISAGTLSGHLSAGKERLRVLLADLAPHSRSAERLNGASARDTNLT